MKVHQYLYLIFGPRSGIRARAARGFAKMSKTSKAKVKCLKLDAL